MNDASNEEQRFNEQRPGRRHGPRRGGHRPHGRGAEEMGFGPMGPMGPFGLGGPFGPGGPMGPRGRGRGRRGQVRQAILALLAEEPLNGYQIMQTVAERTDGAWKPSPGAVYPALSQLEDEGLIESFNDQGQKAFRLTDTGKDIAASVEKPWEQVNEAVAGMGSTEHRALWSELPGLIGALKELARTGSTEQIVQATTMLGRTRRAVYALLAEDEADAADRDEQR